MTVRRRAAQRPILTLLQTQLDRCGLRPPAHPHLPFLGGALGLFGYDLGRRFESLPAHAVADIALPDMAVGIYDWALIVDHQRREVSLLSYGDPHARLHWLEAQSAAPTTPFALTSARRSNMSREQYGEKFRQVQARCTAATATSQPRSALSGQLLRR